MKEINDIIRAFDKAQKKGIKAALATVVHVDGSSYRRPGARMLVTEEGQLTGAISGGCLEGDALRKAQLVLHQQKTKLVTYNTMDEDDAKFGVGLGCNGIIQVLIEPIIIDDANNPIELLRTITRKRQKAILATLFSLQNRNEDQLGTCLVLNDEGIMGKINDAFSFKELLMEDANKALRNQTSSFKNYISEKQNITAFVEFVEPVVSLIVIGAGNDVIPLVDLANVLGWEIRVIDGRANYAKPERFVSACQVLVSKPENVLEQISIDEQTVFILMTHNYNYDLAMLKALIKKEVVYIGSLGPKKKLDRMLGDLKEEGIQLTLEQLKMIYGPSGLDIGAETPEEIALSILAEIKAVLSDKKGQSLRNNQDVIHQRSETLIEKIRIPK